VAQLWLNEHRRYRRGWAQELSWSADLAKSSADYANILEDSLTFAHGDRCQVQCDGSRCDEGKKLCGQNLAKRTGDSTSPLEWPGLASRIWMDECLEYDGQFEPKTGHYTQMMWRDASLLGCGASEGGTVAACLYNRGNVKGDFGANVPPTGVPACNKLLSRPMGNRP
jgi:hypothetical protein